jgi:hypothetical protein
MRAHTKTLTIVPQLQVTIMLPGCGQLDPAGAGEEVNDAKIGFLRQSPDEPYFP